MRGSCLTRIYPYSSKSFMAFSGSLKLSVNSYSEENKSIMVYTVKLLIMNVLYMYGSLVYNITCIKLYTCFCYCVASMKKTTLSLYIVDMLSYFVYFRHFTKYMNMFLLFFFQRQTWWYVCLNVEILFP